MATDEHRSLTLRDVSEASGVSEMTVSRVLRNRGDVSAATRQKVLKAAKELGYVPNKIAGACLWNWPRPDYCLHHMMDDDKVELSMNDSGKPMNVSAAERLEKSVTWYVPGGQRDRSVLTKMQSDHGTIIDRVALCCAHVTMAGPGFKLDPYHNVRNTPEKFRSAWVQPYLDMGLKEVWVVIKIGRAHV